jgi:hypothetical protein
MRLRISADRARIGGTQGCEHGEVALCKLTNSSLRQRSDKGIRNNNEEASGPAEAMRKAEQAGVHAALNCTSLLHMQALKLGSGVDKQKRY